MRTYWSRRELLRATGAGAGLAVTAGLLAACSGAGSVAPVVIDPSRAARSGGVLRAAVGGGGPAESLDSFAGLAPADLVRQQVMSISSSPSRADG